MSAQQPSPAPGVERAAASLTWRINRCRHGSAPTGTEAEQMNRDVAVLCDALDARDAEIRELRGEAGSWQSCAQEAEADLRAARARLDEVRALLDEMPVWPDPRRIRAILDRPADGAT